MPIRFLLTFLWVALMTGCVGESPDVSNQFSNDLLTYKTKCFSYTDLGLTIGSAIEILGDGVCEIGDTSICITALDTTEILLHAKTDDQLKTFSFIPKRNPDFKDKWKYIPTGKIPSPLTTEGRRAFANFSKYRLLNKTVPQFEISSTSGRNFNQDSVKGKITLINFWYYGCIPCMAEIPALNDLKDEFENDKSVQIISLFKDSIKVYRASSFTNRRNPAQLPISVSQHPKVNWNSLGIPDFYFRHLMRWPFH